MTGSVLGRSVRPAHRDTEPLVLSQRCAPSCGKSIGPRFRTTCARSVAYSSRTRNDWAVSDFESDARALIEALTGQDVLTVAQGVPNRILGVDGDDAIVGTDRTPTGQRVELTEIQAALDRLMSGESVEVNVDSLGHRSSFIGALLASLPDTEVDEGPPVRITRRAPPTADSSRQSNPDWTWDEQILAFDLYIREGPLRRTHPEVIALSEFLQKLSVYPPESRGPTFRNPNGVQRKLGDIHSHAPDYRGQPTRGSKLDTEVWVRFGANPAEATTLAEEIRLGVGLGLGPTEEEEDDKGLERQEGRVVYVYRLHRRVERDRALIAKKKAAVLGSTGALACEACGFDFAARYGEVGEGFAEVHHAEPLHLGERTTRLEDLVVLCANCHRIAHRMEPLPTLQALRATLR